MVEWLAGNRIQGTSTERTVGTPEVPAVSGGWKELGRHTLGTAGDTITVSSLPDKRYYMFLNDLTATGGTIAATLRLNNDNSGTVGVSGNYARRRSINGGSDNTYTNDVNMTLNGNTDTNPRFDVGYLANLSSKEKLNITHGVYQTTAGAGNAPTRTEITNKWDNTSDAINRLDVVNAGTGNFDTGSEVVVLGYDPDDTHTDNFWEELASVDLSGGSADLLSSGTITAKKYLWVQAYIEPTGTVDIDITFNNDNSGTNGVDGNYARRNNYNGGTDSTNNYQNNLQWSNNVTVPQFMNCFIINNSANEKLSIMEQVRQGTAGAGTAPDRYHISGKWSNTSSQITEIDITNGESGSYDTNSFIKVWGSN